MKYSNNVLQFKSSGTWKSLGPFFIFSIQGKMTLWLDLAFSLKGLGASFTTEYKSLNFWFFFILFVYKCLFMENKKKKCIFLLFIDRLAIGLSIVWGITFPLSQFLCIWCLFLRCFIDVCILLIWLIKY